MEPAPASRGAAFLVFSLYVCGALLNGRPWARRLEVLRLVAAAGTVAAALVFQAL